MSPERYTNNKKNSTTLRPNLTSMPPHWYYIPSGTILEEPINSEKIHGYANCRPIPQPLPPPIENGW